MNLQPAWDIKLVEKYKGKINMFTPNYMVIELLDGNIDIVLKFFSFYQKNYQYTSKYKNGLWNGTVCFAKPIKNQKKVIIPTGLFKHAQRIIDFINPPEYPSFPKKERFELKNFTLRDYQKEAVDKAIEAKRGIIKLPTGVGKTVVAFEIARLTSVPTVFIVNRRDLLFQTYMRAKDFGFKNVGIIGSGEFVPTGDFDIATIQSLFKLAGYDDDFFNQYQLLIFDECHHINYSANITKKTLVRFKNAWWRFGFSATPFRYDCQYADDISLVAYLDFPIVDVSHLEGYTADITVIPIFLRHPNAFLLSGIPYHTALKNLTKMEERWDIFKNILERHKEDKVLLIAPTVQHCIDLANYLGIDYVHGSLPKEERKRIYKKFSETPNMKLVATTVYDEGVDFPDLNVIVFTEPFSSYLKLIQRIGRGRRIHKNKDRLLVYDVGDEIFVKQFKRRMRTYSREGFEIEKMKEIYITRKVS